MDRHRLIHTRTKSKGLKRKRNDLESDCDDPNVSKPRTPTGLKQRSSTSSTVENKGEQQQESTKPINNTLTPDADGSKGKANIKQEIALNDSTSENQFENVNSIMDQDEVSLVNSAAEVEGRLQCPICPRTLSHRKILRLHIRSHLGKNLLHCKVMTIHTYVLFF